VWLDGIRADPHCCAIFSQHSCSAAVICSPGRRQSSAGVTAHITVTKTIVNAPALAIANSLDLLSVFVIIPLDRTAGSDPNHRSLCFVASLTIIQLGSSRAAVSGRRPPQPGLRYRPANPVALEVQSACGVDVQQLRIGDAPRFGVVAVSVVAKSPLRKALARSRDCECNGLWLLKTLLSGLLGKNRRARILYKRFSRNLDTFTTIRDCQKRTLSTPTPVIAKNR